MALFDNFYTTEKQENCFTEFLTDSGGSKAMQSADGSVTNVSFAYTATKTTYIGFLQLLIVGVGKWDSLLNFVDNAAALTNGFLLRKKVGSTATNLIAQALKSNADILTLFPKITSELDGQTFTTTDHRWILAQWSAKQNQQKISLANGDKIEILIQDNMTTANVTLMYGAVGGHF